MTTTPSSTLQQNRLTLSNLLTHFKAPCGLERKRSCRNAENSRLQYVRQMIDAAVPKNIRLKIQFA